MPQRADSNWILLVSQPAGPGLIPGTIIASSGIQPVQVSHVASISFLEASTQHFNRLVLCCRRKWGHWGMSGQQVAKCSKKMNDNCFQWAAPVPGVVKGYVCVKQSQTPPLRSSYFVLFSQSHPTYIIWKIFSLENMKLSCMIYLKVLNVVAIS